MGRVCEHMFERSDPNEPDYSMEEYDLYAKLDLTLRKNLVAGKFELVGITEGKRAKGPVMIFNSLDQAVQYMNDLEGANNTEISCDGLFHHR